MIDDHEMHHIDRVTQVPDVAIDPAVSEQLEDIRHRHEQDDARHLQRAEMQRADIDFRDHGVERDCTEQDSEHAPARKAVEGYDLRKHTAAEASTGEAAK